MSQEESERVIESGARGVEIKQFKLWRGVGVCGVRG